MCIDWLAGTAKWKASAEELVPELGEQEWATLRHGRYGYRGGRAFGSSRIWYDGRDDMGTMLELSGQACRELEAIAAPGAESPAGRESSIVPSKVGPATEADQAGGGGDWVGRLAYLLALGIKPTRLDLAMDDREGLLDLDQIERDLRAGNVTSLFRRNRRSCRKYEDFDLGGGEASGRTLYLGRPTSDVQVRFYDKGAQLKQEGHWIRCEVQLRGIRAQLAAEAIVEHGDLRAVAGILRSYVQFRVPNGSDSNRRRWEVAGWWDAFLGAVERINLTAPGKPKSVQEVAGWIEKQLAPNLALVAAGLGWSVDDAYSWVSRLCQEGRKRWDHRHRAILAAA